MNSNLTTTKAMFKHEILSNGAEIEVVSPEWLCEEIKENVRGMYNLYFT